MKSLRMFGLAALMALLAMAFVGTGSATAEGLTGLCLSEGEEIEGVMRCTVPEIHETSVENAALLTSLFTVKCEVLFLGEVTAKGLEESELKPLVVKGKYTFSGCGEGCTVTEEGGPSTLKYLRKGHETAEVTAKATVHTKCAGIECSYGAEAAAGTAKGALLSSAKNGEVTFSGVTLKKISGSAFCPSTGKLDLKTTPLEPIYIVNAEDILLGFCPWLFSATGLYNSWGCTEQQDNPNHTGRYEFFSI